ncbi:MAG: hypothetical protein JO257_35685 [Deltaproteobacteria bacterium]|nr:hypothetical protein [Deltaproteobacteria bacterium]
MDIEPALNAALARGQHDLILFDPITPGLPRATIEARLREHRVDLPIIELDHEPPATLADRIRAVLASRRH